MNCSHFDHWLDDGRPHRGAPAALTHTRNCPRCADLWRVEEELEAAMQQPAESPSPGFADRVMARVQASGESLTSAAVAYETWSLPWWVNAAAQPAVALCSLIVAGLLWRYQDLWT